MKNSLTFILFISTFQLIHSQTEVKKFQHLPSVAIGAGVLSFNGDLANDGTMINSFARVRTGYNLTIEQRIGNYLGISLNCIYGKLADSERSKARNLNFQSKIIQTDLNIDIHFDSLIFKRNLQFAPYLFIGFGYLKFDPYEDLTDKNGIKYNYWSDGSIRSLPQGDLNSAYATILQRDYTYETKRVDSANNSKNSTFTIPIGVALNLKITDHLSVNVGGAYYLTFTDWIDNIKNDKNDKYIFANVSVKYTFTKTVKKGANTTANNDFLALEKSDEDGDGVVDINDQCQGTPKGVTVDINGCPIDADEDGIPDYRDKELTTKKGAMVDTEGVTQTNKMITEKYKKNASLPVTDRSYVFNQNPSLAYLKALDDNASNTTRKNKVIIPVTLRSADINNDGYISSSEITATIDAFFDGTSDFTVERLNDLVDFYFEQ